MRIAIIGAGISGIAFAGILRRFGHECILYEKRESIGGIWALAYPDVRLQNSYEQYGFVDFPWPERPDQHPTARQILDYLHAAVAHFDLDVRLRHVVTGLSETANGWSLTAEHNGAQETLAFDYAIVAIGQYAEEKYRPEFPGEADFAGTIMTEREVESLEVFRGQRVAVVGFGKSAVDMASFAAPIAGRVSHVFRTPRWLIPFRICGVHFTYPFFARATTAFMPSWVHGGRLERALHRYAAPLVSGFWTAIGIIVKAHIRRHARGRDEAAAQRLAKVTPRHGFAPDLRSATAMAPLAYYELVADGVIEPHHAEVKGFSADSLELANGERIEADVVVLSVGSKTPVFPFLPAACRDVLECEPDGVQLYRHLLHPRLPRLAFAGYNHGFMHVPCAEISALWLCAALRGDIELPDSVAQERSIETILAWKRAHIQFEPSRSCAVSTRFQQYMDAMLLELGISPYRKLPNLVAEGFGRYGSFDYHGIVAAYLAASPHTARSTQAFDA